MNRKVLVVGGLIALPLLLLLAWGFRFDPRGLDSPLVGGPAPDFALERLDGGVVRLAELRGKPVMINFWATWCQPCIVEHPVLIAGSRAYAGRVEFLGIVYQDEPAKIAAFLDRRGAWGSTLLDPGNKVAIAYGVYGAPETFFLDAEGRIVEKVTGVVDPATLRRILDSLLT